MAKISELPPITGANTRSEDLFVIVNLVQGDDGTSNITRKELVEAIQYEIFSRITITGGTISGVVMSDSRLDNVRIDNSDIEDTDFIRGSIDNTEITNSTANNITITSSTFDNGVITNSTGNNVVLTSSELNDSTANNVVITNSQLLDSTANNVVITNSEFNDGTGNNVVLTNSELNDSTANNVVITNSQLLDSVANNTVITNSQLNDSTANNVTISASIFQNGQLISSTGEDLSIANSDITTTDITASNFLDGNVNNSVITSSEFNDGTANNVIITNSQFNDGTGNNVVLTNSTIDDSTFTDGTISNTQFTGTMDNVVATDIQIRSSSADGLSSNNSSFENGTLETSTFSGGVIDQSKLVDFDMDLTKEFDPPIDEESYFAIRNEQTGETEQISFGQLFDEVSKKTAQALKVHVDAGSGNDDWPGTQMQPVKTLERAFELCLEKAGGEFDRNAVNNAVHISAGPGTYYTKGNLMLPDDCSCTSTAGQYATVIEALPGYENNNAILVGSGCYVQGFSYQNWKIDNFDFPEGGFAIAYRPGAKLLRSPYLRDSTQLSNFNRLDVEPPLNPYNSKGTLADLGQQFYLANTHTGTFAVDDEIKFSSGAVGYITYVDELASDNEIYVRNLKNGQGFAVGDTVTAESGGTGVVETIGIDDFPNRLVGRGGGCVLADRRVLDPDSLYTYVLCFGFTPRSQNGIGYVARDGAGVNGIGSLSIFVRCAFYALNGGQMTLNNSGTQFGDISMRAKGTTEFFQPRNTTATIIGNTAFADTIETNEDLIIEDMVDYLTANTAQGGLGYTGYDANKCERDSGIILDGVGYDIALNTNYWSRLAGITYRSPISSKVIGEQLDATLGANQYLQSRVEDIFSGANAEIVSRANTSFQELYNVIEFGEENMNPIIWQDTTVEQTAARELLQNNRSFIQDELIDWIENNDEFYAYNSATCRRDTKEYILPAVKNDMLFDTNYNSVTAGRAYYMATAAKVVGQQKNETIEGYRRLKDQTNEIIDANTYIGTSRVDAGFDEIIGILGNTGTKYTPTNATYNPSTGEMVITIGTHSLTPGRKILFAENAITFSCDTDGNVATISHPRQTDGAFNSPIEVVSVTNTTITVFVPTSAYTGVHNFVRAKENGIATLGSAITWSDSTSIAADKRNARKQLQANRGFIQDLVTGYIDNNYFIYDSDKCKRDQLEYIIPAVQRDVITGSNFNAIQSGEAYRGAHGDVVIEQQLPQTVGAITELKQLFANNVITDPSAEHLSNESFDQMIDILNNEGKTYTPTNATYDPITGVMVLTIGSHDLQVGESIYIADGSITFECGSPAVQISHPRPTDPYYRKAISIDKVSATTITCNVGDANGYTGAHTFISANANSVKLASYNSSYTPSTATYDPVTGVMTATIGKHNLVKGDFIQFKPLSITFECNGDEITHPRPADPYYKTPVRITAVTADTITMNVGDAGGYTGAHTFVRADVNAIDADPILWTDPASIQQFYTPTTATYDPVTGLSVVTIPGHNIAQGDYIEFLPYSFTFTCAQDGNATEHSYPRKGDGNYRAPMEVTVVAGDDITVNVGVGSGGAHTFVSVSNNAVARLTYNSAGQRAREQLQANRTFLQEEVMAYLDTQYFIFDGDKCSRDTGLILDAVRRDVATGSNYNSVFAGLSYRLGGAGAQLVYQEQLTETVGAIEYLKSEIATELTGGALTRSNAAFDEIIDILSNGEANADVIAFGTDEVSASHTEARTALQLNKAFLQAEVTAYIAETFPGLTYDVAKCERDTGFLVDAISWDIQHGSNAASVNFARMYYDNAIAVLPADQILPTAKTWAHIAEVCYNIVRDVAVTPTTGNGATQDLTQTDVGINIGNAVRDLIGLTVNVIRDNTLEWLPSYDEPQIESGYTSAVNKIDGRTETLQSSVIDYIRDEYNGLPYNKAKCKRDVGLIVDAVSKDIEYGGNASTIEAATYYFTRDPDVSAAYEQLRATNVLPLEVKGQFANLPDTANVSGLRESINILPYEQREPTRLAFAHLADVAANVAIETAVSVSNANTVPTQDTSGIPADVATAQSVHDLINTIANLVDDDETENIPTATNPRFDPNRTMARLQLQKNREFLQEEVIAYLNDRYFTFDGDKCKRDVGIIIDAVKRDQLTDSNFNAVFNGLAYRSGTTGTNLVVNEQLTETVKAVEYARDIAVAAITDTGAQERATNAFNEIIDIMGNGSGNADTITFGTVSANGNNGINARSQLQNNKAFLQAEMTAWLAVNHASLTYDVAKCERDVGYLVDSVSFDIMHGGNSASINNAKLYFENALSVLPEDQRAPTAQAFAHIAACAELIVQDTDIGGLKSVGNAASQDFSSGSAGVVLGQTVQDLFNIVADAISENDLDGMPDVVEPTASAYNQEYQDAVTELDGIKATVQGGVLGYLAQYFEVLPYNEDKCRRDTGYIIDAVSHDIQYGGNACTVNAAGMYFENAVNTLPKNQQQATKEAFTHLANTIEHVVQRTAVTATVGNAVAQDTVHVAANPLTATAAKNLTMIVANTVDDLNPTIANLPEKIEPLQTWQAANYVDSKELMEDNAVALADNVLSYISNVWNGLSYPKFKCRRDIGYLVDAISHDVQYDTNSATRITSQIYFENGVSVLPADTRIQTADVYNYLGTVVENIVQEIDVANTTYTDSTQDTSGTPATAVEGARVSELIGYVEDVIRNDSLAGLPGPEQANTAWIDSELLGAAQQIDDNTEILAQDLTDYINTEFGALDYNRDKCRRDTGYLLDAFSFDLNFGGNTASRWNADFYFWNNAYRIPEDQRIPTAKSYRQLGRICKDIVIGKYPGMTVGTQEVASDIEAAKVQKLADMFYKTQIYKDTKYLLAKEEPTYTNSIFEDALDIIKQNRQDLAFDTVRYVGATYKYIDINLTRRDAKNLLTAIENDFRYEDVTVPAPSYTTNGSSNATMTYTAAFFDWQGKHVFPVFNPSNPALKYQGSVQGPVSNGNLAAITGMKPNHAYIVATDMNVSEYAGTIYYWDGSAWQLDGTNNTDLLDAFTGAWDRMRDYIVNNYSPNSTHSLMVEGLFNDCLKGNILRPQKLTFGSLVESIAHQFNGASAGVNRNALPLNFRNLGAAISAVASVLNEDGGRIRWSGADELNNQYFARGLRINGRTGRIEGRPFTSSVRKLARRASNSRAVI